MDHAEPSEASQRRWAELQAAEAGDPWLPVPDLPLFPPMPGLPGMAPLDEQSPQERAYAPHPLPNGLLGIDPDFTLPTTAGPLPWRLFYFSDQGWDAGPFGYGRRASWPLRLVTSVHDGRNKVEVEREDGRRVRYSDQGDLDFTCDTPRCFDTLELADDEWQETRFETGAVFHFPAGPFASLSYFETVHGRRVTLNYSSGRMVSLQEPAGREIAYSYDPEGRVTQVEDWAGRAWQMAYNDAGDLTSVTAPDAAVTTYQ